MMRGALVVENTKELNDYILVLNKFNIIQDIIVDDGFSL